MLFILLILVIQLKKTEYNAKIEDIKDKFPDHYVYFTTKDF